MLLFDLILVSSPSAAMMNRSILRGHPFRTDLCMSMSFVYAPFISTLLFYVGLH